MVTQQESLMGYPEHILLTIGHLAEASEECVEVSQELADEIRSWRLILMEDGHAYIPYFELYKKVKKLTEDKGCGDCKKASQSFKERVNKAI